MRAFNQGITLILRSGLSKKEEADCQIRQVRRSFGYFHGFLDSLGVVLIYEVFCHTDPSRDTADGTFV